MNSRYYKLLVFVVVAFISSIISYNIVSHNLFMHLEDIFLADKGIDEGTDNLLVINGEIIEATIIMKVQYDSCGHVEYVHRETLLLDNAEILDNKNIYEDLVESYPEYCLLHGEDLEFTLVKTVDGICPFSEKHLHIGIEDDMVAIFMGPPKNGEVREILNIGIKNLPQSEIDRLRSGIEVASEYELLGILEGLSSLTPFFRSRGDEDI